MRFSAPIGATSLRLAPVLSLYNLRPLCTPLTLTARPANFINSYIDCRNIASRTSTSSHDIPAIETLASPRR
jgi:hypothetical protein